MTKGLTIKDVWRRSRLLSIPDAAHKLGLSETAMAWLVSHKKIDRRKFSSKWYVTSGDVDDFADACGIPVFNLDGLKYLEDSWLCLGDAAAVMFTEPITVRRLIRNGEIASREYDKKTYINSNELRLHRRKKFNDSETVEEFPVYWFPESEVAKILDVRPSTANSYMLRVGAQAIGERLFISRAAVDALLEENFMKKSKKEG